MNRQSQEFRFAISISSAIVVCGIIFYIGQSKSRRDADLPPGLIVRGTGSQESSMKHSKSDPVYAQHLGSAVAGVEKSRVFVLESEVRAKMVREMGERRDLKAIPTLLDLMFIVRTGSNPSHIEETFPCAMSLIQIGEPAVEQIQDRILAAPNISEEYVLLCTLASIKGGHYVGIWIHGAKKADGTPLSDDRRARIQNWALSVGP